MASRSETNSSAPPSSNAGLALRFISGKYQGGEFPLGEGQEIIIGRSSDLDMVLVEEMVSRRHARITVKRGAIMIEDLGSTNGTFVNGEKIDRASLREGDRVLVGTSILKVVRVAPSAENRDYRAVAANRESQRQSTQRSEEAPRMSGALDEIPLPDLLQLLGTSRKNGVLVLRTGAAVGRIFLEGGVIRCATIENIESLPPRNAVYRMLGWTTGHFELEPPQEGTFEQPIEATVQEILMEGLRQQDEFAQLRDQLPPMAFRIILRTPLEAPLHVLEPAHLEVLQQSLNSPNLAAVFERSRNTDLETAEILLSLMKRGYVTAVGG
jgi:pSer/pThr/pTyr-binding forkhead associated (FHA) protein